MQTNEDLCLRAQAGDAGARDTLILKNLPWAQTVARRYVFQARKYFHCDAAGRASLPVTSGCRDNAGNLDDLTQAAVVGMLEAVADWNPDRGSFLTLATLYMRKECRALLGVRSKKRTLDNVGELARLDGPAFEDENGPAKDVLCETVPDKAAADPESLFLKAEEHRMLHESLRALPEIEFEAVTLCRMQGRTAEQAAETLGLTPSQVRYTLQEAMRRLRKTMVFDELKAASCDPKRYGLAAFKTSFTSSTEAAALKRIEQGCRKGR